MVNNLEVVWLALEKRYGEKFNVSEVMHQVVLMYIFSLLIGDYDRNSDDWLIEESDKGIKLASLFDNECGFRFIGTELEMGFSTNYEDYFTSLGESLRVFLKNSSSEYLDLFKEKFEVLNSNFMLLFDMVEQQIGVKIPDNVKQNIINVFNKNNKIISGVLEDFEFKKSL